MAADLFQLGFHPRPILEHDTRRFGEVRRRPVVMEFDIGGPGNEVVDAMAEFWRFQEA